MMSHKVAPSVPSSDDQASQVSMPREPMNKLLTSGGYIDWDFITGCQLHLSMPQNHSKEAEVDQVTVVDFTLKQLETFKDQYEIMAIQSRKYMEEQWLNYNPQNKELKLHSSLLNSMDVKLVGVQCQSGW